MTPSVAVSVAAVLITLISGFAALFMKLGRLETKIDLMWEWYCSMTGGPRIGGRRKADHQRRAAVPLHETE